MESPALGRALDARGQIPLAECIVLDVYDEGVTEQIQPGARLGLALKAQY